MSLKTYSIIAASLFAPKAESQLIIENYEPDLRMMNWPGEDNDDEIRIDLNGNGIDDVIFNYEAGPEIYLELEIQDAVTGLYANEGLNYLIPLYAGDIVDDNLNWSSEVNLMKRFASSSTTSNYVWSASYGYFDRNDYLPLKLNLDGNTHYGWLRLSVLEIVNFGSPLTIYEFGYNEIPDQNAICDANTANELNVSLVDTYDTDNVSEFEVYVKYDYEDAINEISELRIYLLNDHESVYNFSVSNALLLPPTNYYSIPGDAITGYSISEFILPAYLLNIQGEPFDQETGYSIFSLPVPTDITQNLTLSAPSTIRWAMDQPCLISQVELEIPVVEQTPSGLNIQFEFTSDPDESDILHYKAGLADYEAITFDNLEDPVDGNYAIIPANGEPYHYVILEGITHTIDEKQLENGESYKTIIYGEPDGEFRDDPCYKTGFWIDYVANENVYPNDSIRIFMHNNNLNAIVDAEFINYFPELKIISINGQSVYSQKIDQAETIINLNHLVPGIYGVIIYGNGNILKYKNFAIH